MDGVTALPRELAPGVFWLGDCLHMTYQGRRLHTYNSVFVVAGDDRSAVVEAGHPESLHVVEGQLEALLERRVAEPSHVFLTHTETPHCAGVGRLLDRFPAAVACGDVSDLHLVFPQHADRLVALDPGDAVDLGGTRLAAVEAVFRDQVTTRWGFDTRSRTLFAGDGFSYAHYHAEGQCGALAEEAGELDLPDMVALFADLAFYWTRFVDIEPYVARLDELLFDELGAATIAPTHGLPIGDPEATLAAVRRGWVGRGARGAGGRHMSGANERLWTSFLTQQPRLRPPDARHPHPPQPPHRALVPDDPGRADRAVEPARRLAGPCGARTAVLAREPLEEPRKPCDTTTGRSTTARRSRRAPERHRAPLLRHRHAVLDARATRGIECLRPW